MTILSTLSGWFRFGSRALGDTTGAQRNDPSEPLNEGIRSVGVDAAFQIAAVWACIERIATTIATLPLFVYEDLRGKPGQRALARDAVLYQILHDSPNARMTPAEFWTAVLLNLLLRGNGYARIERDAKGEAYALWPMPADQVQPWVLDDGSLVYQYRIGADMAVLSSDNVLHIKGLGNGTMGMARIDYMRSTLDEARNAQAAANKLFSAGGKPTGVLMIDAVLNKDQRKAVLGNFAEMAAGGSTGRLFLLEANMKYQQLSLSPEAMQLLTTRQFTKQEIGTWFGVPSILINQTEGSTTLGSSSGEIIESFHKLTIRPLLVHVEQALRKRVMTPAQRARYSAEFSQDALLRASLKDRAEIYAKLVQNGIKTRNECRQLENDAPIDGGDELTAQTNLAPLRLLGQVKPGAANADTQIPVAQ